MSSRFSKLGIQKESRGRDWTKISGRKNLVNEKRSKESGKKKVVERRRSRVERKCTEKMSYEKKRNKKKEWSSPLIRVRPYAGFVQCYSSR